jgi:glucose-1-phosphate cytidylyltransferase
MKYYSHYGFNDFILCLGYRGDVIKQYFLNYDECLSNNFVLAKGGKDLHLFSSDIQDWTVTFVDTGLHSNLGQRLKAVEPYLEGGEIFMANYTDGLSDLDLTRYLAEFRRRQVTGSFVAVRPNQSFHVVDVDDDGFVRDVRDARTSGVLINGGFFIFTSDIFKVMRKGEELVDEPFRRLIERNQLLAYRHDGFWSCMDTFKDKQRFDEMEARGDTPWRVWGERRGHA